jgi:hypothetical protein
MRGLGHQRQVVGDQHQRHILLLLQIQQQLSPTTWRWWPRPRIKLSLCMPVRWWRLAMRRIFSARTTPGSDARRALSWANSGSARSSAWVYGWRGARKISFLLNPRCPYATDKCRSEEPALADLTGGRQSKCHYPASEIRERRLFATTFIRSIGAARVQQAAVGTVIFMPGGLDYEYAKGRHATTAVAGH